MTLMPRTHSQASFILIIASLLLFLAGFFSLPPTDRDESRFAQATKQMVQSGDYINIRFQDEARNKKPIGIYWLQAAAVKLSGLGEGAPIWVYRIPSLLGAMGAVLLTYWALLAICSREEAFFAALLLSACVLLGAEARLAKTDAMLLATIIAATGALLRAFLKNEKSFRNAFIFWFALAAGTLIKGPVILLIVGASALAFSIYGRSAAWLRTLRPLPGLALYALLVLPWFIAIFHATGGAFFQESVGRDMFAKVVSGQEMHGAPPGTYFGLLWFTFFPSACFLAAGIPWLWRNKKSEKTALLWLWVLPTWLVFELVPTKLPHYVLPLYPALAALAVLALAAQDWKLTTRWQRFCMSSMTVVPPALLVLALTLLWIGEARLDWIVLLLVPVSFALGFIAFRISKTDARRSVVLTAVIGVILYFGIFGRVLPRIDEFWLSPRLAQAVKANAPCDNPLLASVGYQEPSLVFLTTKDIFMTDAKGAADFLLQGGCRVALIDEKPALEAFEQRLRTENVHTKRLAVVFGRNVNGAHERQIGLWTLKAAPAIHTP